MSSTGSAARRLSVALVDDHEVVAVALELAIAAVDRLTYAGAAATVDELIESFPAAQLAVLDLRLTDGSSPATNVRRLNDAGLDVIVYTSGEDPDLLRAAARTGALGIVRKSAPLSTLIDALTRAVEGLPIMSTELAAAIDSDPGIVRAALSAQERRVLALFARGQKAQSVATQLGISVPTVNDYVRRIRSKYREAGRPAHTKVDLYVRAVEDGILPGPTAE